MPDSEAVIPGSEAVIPDSEAVMPDSEAVIPGSTRDPGSPGAWIADQVRNDNIKSSIISFVSPNKKHKW